VSGKQLRPDLGPVLLKMALQFTRLHMVDPRRALIAFHRSQCCQQILFLNHFFRQALVHRSSSEASRSGVASPSLLARCGYTASAVRTRRGGCRSCCSSRIWSLWTLPVPSLAPFFRSSALRSSRVTGLLRCRPRCQFVFLRSRVCYPLLSASPRGYALRFRYGYRHRLRLAPFIQQDSAHAGHTGAGWNPWVESCGRSLTGHPRLTR
jgi:hypothetical protein